VTSAAIPTTPSVVINGTLGLSGGVTLQQTAAISIAGTGFNNGGAIRGLSGNNSTGAAPITLTAAASLQSDVANGLNIGTGATAINGATFGLTLQGVGSGTINGTIGTTTGTLTVGRTVLNAALPNDIGSWTLAGTAANTYTGVTSVNSGTLVLNKTG